MSPHFIAQNRRRPLKFLAASPLAALPASGWQNVSKFGKTYDSPIFIRPAGGLKH